MAGQTVTCPHCQLETILFIPRDWREKPKPKIESETSKEERKKMVENEIARRTGQTEAIEDKLEGFGLLFFWAGVIGAIIAVMSIFAILANATQNEDNGGELLSLVAFGIVSVGQGIIINTLFKAAAEVIRLLRQIAKKSATIR